MDFEHAIAQAWDDHATDAAGVAARLQTVLLPLVTAPAHIAPLARLAHHVHGEHLGRWDAGRALLATLSALPGCAPDAATVATLRGYDASLALGAGHADALQGLDTGQRVGALAMAAASLTGTDIVRAAALFQQALDEAAALPESGPHTRALAVTGNNLASTLEQKAGRSSAERALMLLAAQTARRCWAIAGGWLETERADYRLAMSWLQAGDPAQARAHAQACLDRVAANGNPALERFFGLEALALAEAAAGHAGAQAAAVAQAREAFAALDEADRSWCQPTLAALQAAAPGS